MPLPFLFDLEEKIIKTLFSELVRKDDTVKANAFKSYPKDHDEVSVTRHYYTNTMFCKNLKNFINKSGYCGLARLFVRDIRDCDAFIQYTPTEVNIFHSDIKVGIEIKEGMTIHPYYSDKLTQLRKKAKYFKDTCPDTDNWCGEEI